jgi:hypothetical protein
MHLGIQTKGNPRFVYALACPLLGNFGWPEIGHVDQ